MDREERGDQGRPCDLKALATLGRSASKPEEAARLELPMTRQEQQRAAGLDLAAFQQPP
jgi:hypothetical protein